MFAQDEDVSLPNCLQLGEGFAALVQRFLGVEYCIERSLGQIFDRFVAFETDLHSCIAVLDRSVVAQAYSVDCFLEVLFHVLQSHLGGKS